MSEIDNARADVLKRALRRFDEAYLPQKEMRTLALAARRFVSIPGAQWEGDGWADEFENSIRVEIPKVQRGVRKLETDYRQNRIVPEFRPDGRDADPDTANLLNGLHRADSYEYKAQEARDNAFSEAAAGGFGAYRLANVEADEYDVDNDYQRINPGLLIADADQRVFFDPQATRYDKSDARFGIVLTAYTKDGLREAWGDDRIVSWPDTGCSQQFDWYATEFVYVAEYYEKEERKENCYRLTHGMTGKVETYWHSDLDDVAAWLDEMQAAGFKIEAKRKKRCRVHKYVLSGSEILEDCGFIAGPHIPIVPVYYRRAYVDGCERFEGHVQSRMDAQRLYNSSVSRIAEVNATSPREVPIFAPEQMPLNLADQWARAHIDRLPFLLAVPLTDPNTGSIIQAGPLGYVKPADVPPTTAALLQIANNDLIEDDLDGADEVKANTSADAMDIAASRVDAKSGVILDNMRQSVQWEATVYYGMAPECYGEQGREVNAMTDDGDDKQEVLVESHTDANGENKIRHDFSRGRYKAIASVAEATATRRDKTVRSALQIADVALGAQDLEMAQAAIVTAVSNSDGEGIEDLQKFARKRGLSIGLFEPNEDETKQMQEQAQQPDPNAKLADAQSNALNAQAAKDAATVEKIGAETAKAEAQTLQIVADIGAPKIRMGNQA